MELLLSSRLCFMTYDRMGWWGAVSAHVGVCPVSQPASQPA